VEQDAGEGADLPSGSRAPGAVPEHLDPADHVGTAGGADDGWGGALRLGRGCRFTNERRRNDEFCRRFLLRLWKRMCGERALGGKRLFLMGLRTLTI